MKRILFLLCLLLGQWSVAFSTPEVIEIQDSLGTIVLKEYLEVLQDPEQKMSIADVTSPAFVDNFVALFDLFASSPKEVNRYWLRFSIRNPRPNKIKLLLSIDHIDEAQLYVPDSRGEFDTYRGGASLALEHRPIYLGRTPVIPFEMDPQESKTFYVLAEFTSSFHQQNKFYFSALKHISLSFQEPSVTSFNNSRFNQGFYFGAVIIIALYNFFIFWFEKEKSHFYYVIFILSSGLANMTLEGFAFEYLWPNFPTWDPIVVQVLTSISWGAFLWFSSTFLDIKAISKLWSKLILIFVGIHGGYIVFSMLFSYWNLYISNSLIFLSILLVFGLNIWMVLKGYRPARYYLIANIFYLTGLVIFFIAQNEWLTPNSWNLHAEEIGEIFQALIFSIALADRLSLLKEKIALKNIEQAEYMRKQEYERKRLIEEQKRQLEEDVKRRTSEIASINIELEEQQEEIIQQRDYIEAKNSELERIAQQILESKNEIDKSYHDIMLLSNIGKQITSSLDTTEIINTVYRNINEMMDAFVFGIGLHDRMRNRIEFKHFYVNNEVQQDVYVDLDEDDRISTWCFKNKKPLFINDFEKEYTKYVSVLKPSKLLEDRKSVIYLPLETEHMVVGVMTVQSKYTNAYRESHLKILETLAAYIAIALDNSYAYDQINEAHKEIEVKNNLLTDSLRYAQDIQEGILPSEMRMKMFFKDHFVIYQPKDYVSGDFYWVKDEGDRKYIAVADCTGHGVPGAFMSMIGTTLLNRVVEEIDFSNRLAEMLELLHQNVRIVLKQETDNAHNNDGMDICLCLIEPLVDSGAVKITFAGAKRPLYYYSEGQLHELKPSRKSIGGYMRKKTVEIEFDQSELLLNENDVLYLTTDGYADQSSEDRKKFGSHTLKAILSQIAHLPMNTQKSILEETLKDHQGEEPQRDDISLVGIRL